MTEETRALIGALETAARTDERVAGALEGLQSRVQALEQRIERQEGSLAQILSTTSGCPRRGEKWIALWASLAPLERRLLLGVSLLLGLALVLRLLALPVGELLAPLPALTPWAVPLEPSDAAPQPIAP